jgi:hypothetical protein
MQYFLCGRTSFFLLNFVSDIKIKCCKYIGLNLFIHIFSFFMCVCHLVFSTNHSVVVCKRPGRTMWFFIDELGGLSY